MLRRRKKPRKQLAPVTDEATYQAERERRAFERIAASMQEKLHPSFGQQAYVLNDYDELKW